MAKKAIILDLDNTIYPVSFIGEELFNELFKMIRSSGEYEGEFEDIKKEVMRKPFQKVAATFKFSKTLKEQSIKHLKTLEYHHPIPPFEDYEYVKHLPIRKFLVTSGFTKMQESKIRSLNINDDFEEVHIIDNSISSHTKKDAFLKILYKNDLKKEDVIIVGDDVDSEIKIAKQLGIDAVLYDKLNKDNNYVPKITNFKDLVEMITGT